MVHEIRNNDLQDPEMVAIWVGIGLSEELAKAERKIDDTPPSRSWVRAFVNEDRDIVLRLDLRWKFPTGVLVRRWFAFVGSLIRG
jgi:hypothetical protein